MQHGLINGYYQEAMERGLLELFSHTRAEGLLPKRRADAHKGDSGRGLVIAGSAAYPGAAFLCAKGAVSAGCGVLSLMSVSAVAPYMTLLPEAVFENIGHDWELSALPMLQKAMVRKTALAIGCGWGKEQALFPLVIRAALEEKTPLVLDADGLNCLSRHRELLPLLHDKVVLTPHPGELSRLTGQSIDSITHDPIQAVRAFSEAYPCVLLLKGALSLGGQGERLFLLAEGNSGLAKGGSGDCLTGVVLALLCQGIEPLLAACLGSYLMGVSADRAFALLGERMLRTTNLFEVLQESI